VKYLSPYGLVTGCDVASIALHYSRKRGLERLCQASVTCLPFCSDWFDLVTSFDVLYHRAVADYPRALVEFSRVLRPGGRILLRLPAYDWLRGRHDKAVQTAHRFTARELHSALVASGFVVEKLSYANTLLFALALTKRLLKEFYPCGRVRTFAVKYRGTMRSSPSSSLPKRNGSYATHSLLA